MFRTAALTAARVARPAVASAVRVAGVARPAGAFVAAVPKVAAFQAVRFYSAGGHLKKEEVFSRIAQVLSGFDKVRLHSSRQDMHRRQAERGMRRGGRRGGEGMGYKRGEKKKHSEHRRLSRGHT